MSEFVPVLVAVQGRPPLVVVGGSAAIAFLLVVEVWWLVGHAIALAHEGGHALMAVLTGGRVTRVRVDRDQTGETEVLVGPVGMVLVTLAGYLAPSAFGLIAAGLIAHGRSAAVLWASLVLLLPVLVVAATWFTRFAVVATVTLIAAVLSRGSDTVVLWAACTWTWILLIGGLTHICLHYEAGADLLALRRLSRIPVEISSHVVAVLALAALWCAFSWLTGIA
ncbi:MAG: hypothetical protein QG622_1417 [Actinomycetota bacterium]|nr:hypothetical protein [Actinomycetota bacterium]